MREETVERALEVTCPVCGASSGEECVTAIRPYGPLLELTGVPVHSDRMEGDW